MGDGRSAEVVPDQGVRHVSKHDLSGHREGRRPRVRPARRVEHGQNPQIDRVNVHSVGTGCEQGGAHGAETDLVS